MPTREVEVSPADVDGTYVVAATFLPVRRWRHVIPFLSMGRRVERQLQATEGLVRYGLRVELRRRHFFTVSVWRDRDAMREFMRTEPHTTAMQRSEEWAGPGALFIDWDSASGSLDWAEARKRLEEAGGR